MLWAGLLVGFILGALGVLLLGDRSLLQTIDEDWRF